MSETPVAKIENIEEMECEACSKTFPNEGILKTHMKTKHSAEELSKEKSDPMKYAPKSTSKGGFEQYQQDLEDKIFAFLGELGEKNVVTNDDVGENEESDKMIGQSNYLENTIVKTPYEPEFDVAKALAEIELPEAVVPKALAEVFRRDIAALWERLSAERERWEFCDPIELHKFENEEFTLVNVPSVIRNYRRKGIELHYPELAIFVLWLTKTCKAGAWKELYAVLAYSTAQYYEYRAQGSALKDKGAWKSFNAEYLARIEKEFPKAVLDEVDILKAEDMLALLRLYAKWVSYFGLE